MCSELEAASAFLVILDDIEREEEEQRPAKRRFWTKPWLQDRDSVSHDSLLAELRTSSPEDYRNYLRMSDASFQHLLSLIAPQIQKQNTVMRKAITVEQRLVATLRYLATGRSLQDLKFSTAISPQALGVIIPETCNAIIDALKSEYMKVPTNAEEWMKVAKDFNTLWNFPNCGGAIDGKHIRITPPPDSGSYYYNYKGFFSIVLMAVVNANYEFVMVDIGRNGRMSDGGVIEQTEFHRKIISKELGLPSNSATEHGLNFVFVADEAFGLHEHILKPYPQRGADVPRKIYNYRLSRARRVVENAFGILANRFRVLHTAINLRIDKIDRVVFACCLLHNYLRRQSGGYYLASSNVDAEDCSTGVCTPGDWRGQAPLTSLQPGAPRNPTHSARDNREAYLQYFNGDGAVEWQNSMIV